MHSLTLQLGTAFSGTNIAFHTVTPGENGNHNDGQGYANGINDVEILARKVINVAKGY
ncbi:MAG TPA: hypothetical protein VN040_19580 [Pseudosphingobacterium sp.]|nr:hypothetical protein [Pseudosphingobacterium sp.]